MAYSILIKNGTIVDGTGKNPYVADIGIAGARIDKIGDLSNERAGQVIDAAGLYVAPGFIDLTNHADVYGTIFKSPVQESLLFQGITTILLGNCGESLAPVARADALKDLERWTTGFSVPVNWNSVAEYQSVLEKLGVGVNIATLVGYDTLHRNSGSSAEKAFLLEKAMKDGALGLSSNFNFLELSDEISAETLKLLAIVKKYNGLYKIHLRDEGKNFLPAVVSAIKLARESGARTVISHFKAVGRGAWNQFPKALRMINLAKKESLDIHFDAFPYLRTGSMLASLLPSWARFGQSDQVLERLRDRDSFFKIAAELKSATLHPEKIFIALALHDKAAVGKTLAELKEKTSLKIEELILEMLKVNELNVTIFGQTISESGLLAALSEPHAAVSSDGAGYNLEYQKTGDLAHPRSFGAFPRFLGYLLPKTRLSLAQAIAKITSIPAGLMGLRGRGVLRSDAAADIVIFSPAELRDRSTYKNPYQYAEGVKYLLISGNWAIYGGSLTGRKSGVILRR